MVDRVLAQDERVIGESSKNLDVDPNVAQRAASHPLECVWVGASAGTGKTKVLTDRVLRLLLPRDDGRAGTVPGRILCLTFTKAAANEMAQRINDILGRWAVMGRDDLTKILKDDLLGVVPSSAQVACAQRLFADVIDYQGGLQIMTIHSFCQSILGRFPLEAGLAPNFQVMDDRQSGQLLQHAQQQVLSTAQKPDYAGSDLAEAVHHVVSDVDEKSFDSLIRSICGERHQFSKVLRQYGDVQGIYNRICDIYGIDPYAKVFDVRRLMCVDRAYDGAALRRGAMAMMQDGSVNGPKRAGVILDWLDGDEQSRLTGFPAYCDVFLTTKGLVRSRKGFPAKKALNIEPDCADVMQIEGQRLFDALDILKRYESARITRDVLMIGQAVLARYGEDKAHQGLVDFDDLVIRTMALLSGDTKGFENLRGVDRDAIRPWIMYKLDQGIDHILVDEAQDTNPEQWQIIEALSAEFFVGAGARDDTVRTSFTVGDLKQSIYSFQRAAPEEFQRMQGVLDQKITASGQVNRNVALDISFRSTESVLRVVDSVFRDETLNKAVGGGDIKHISYRQGQAGCVELWPLFKSAKSDQYDFWTPPTEIREQRSGASQLASYIAQNIRNWLDRKEILPSRGRAIEAGDILILVRSRSAFVDQLVRELKQNKVPVSGSDRMVLGEQLAVQDLMALARFCLFTDDDLSLVCVLKSPFLGWSEEDLFAVSYDRKGSLWQEICNYDRSRLEGIKDGARSNFIAHVSDEKREAARDYLSRLIGRVRYLGAYEFFMRILNTVCPGDGQSGMRAVRGRLGDDALDPIEEFLNVAIRFGHDHIDHMQGFIDEQERQSVEIKREMDECTGQVRIMTIHGAKGLQAPIVIMPDTILSSAARKSGRLLWGHKTDLDVPLYAPRKDDDPQFYMEAKQRADDLEAQESYRLLYVAMTRAADRLYIAGHVGTKGAKDSSWYYHIQRAIEADERCVVVQDDEGDIWRIENEQSADKADKADKQKDVVVYEGRIPDWAYAEAPEEPFPPRPLIPSRPSPDDMLAALSPLKARDDLRFRRGNITHKLLQFLPDFKIERREAAAIRFVGKNARDLSKTVQKGIVDEVMRILNKEEYAPFFKEGSMAEVPVTGLMADNRIVSGQIDRLVIEEGKIWIVDYKTNRPPPKNPDDVAPIYYKQMQAYRDSVAQIYPEHDIKCALLWTDGPHLMILDL